MLFTTLRTRRAAIAVSLLTVLGGGDFVEASPCTQKCKKKKTKEQQQECKQK